MKLIPPAAAVLAALTLAACQDKTVAEAQPADPAVTAAVADAHNASFNPVTGKARDAARGFAAAPPAPVAAGGAPPPTQLGDPGLLGRTLEAVPTESVGGETAF